jgi:hypothetical protein
VIDVYRVDYREALLARWEALNLFARAFFLGLTILGNLLRLTTGFVGIKGKGTGTGKGRREIGQSCTRSAFSRS